MKTSAEDVRLVYSAAEYADYVEEDVVVDDGDQCDTLWKSLQTRCVSGTERLLVIYRSNKQYKWDFSSGALARYVLISPTHFPT